METKNLRLVIKGAQKDTNTTQKVDKILHIIGMTLIYVFLAIMALIIIFPFYWMLITSLKSTEEIRRTTQTFFPEVVMWSNYVDVFKRFDFVTYLRNTLIVGVISTLGTLITTIFAAFAFARLEFKGRDLMFSILLMTMMIPGEMMVITNYITVSNLGWLKDATGVFTSMIVPFWISVFYISLLIQTFKQIPTDVYLAAQVDGKPDQT